MEKEEKKQVLDDQIPELSELLQRWNDELDALARAARAGGGEAIAKEPVLFREIIPRLKQLTRIFIEEEEQLPPPDPQAVWIKATTGANLRTFLLSMYNGQEKNPAASAMALFITLESELEGMDPEEILANMQDTINQKADGNVKNAKK